MTETAAPVGGHQREMRCSGKQEHKQLEISEASQHPANLMILRLHISITQPLTLSNKSRNEKEHQGWNFSYCYQISTYVSRVGYGINIEIFNHPTQTLQLGSQIGTKDHQQ